MKKIVSLLLALVMVLALCACGAPSGGNNSSNGSGSGNSWPPGRWFSSITRTFAPAVAAW